MLRSTKLVSNDMTIYDAARSWTSLVGSLLVLWEVEERFVPRIGKILIVFQWFILFLFVWQWNLWVWVWEEIRAFSTRTKMDLWLLIRFLSFKVTETETVLIQTTPTPTLVHFIFIKVTNYFVYNCSFSYNCRI